jgi:hypothetical protein
MATNKELVAYYRPGRCYMFFFVFLNKDNIDKPEKKINMSLKCFKYSTIMGVCQGNHGKYSFRCIYPQMNYLLTRISSYFIKLQCKTVTNNSKRGFMM